MCSKRKKMLSALGAALFFACQVSVLAQTSPEQFLGFKVGADRQLADYNQIQAYFQKLDQESPKLRVLTVGTSTLKKPMFLAVITSEQNMANLDAYREIVRKLRDPRTTSPEEARNLATEGKVILLITCNLHSTEIASSQMALEFAYKLVTGQTPFDADRALQDVIVLLMPAINPDGQQMVVDWYKKICRHEIRRRTDAMALPSLCRTRQQPRLVHVQLS